MQKEILEMARIKAKVLLKDMTELAAINAKDCKFVPKKGNCYFNEIIENKIITLYFGL